jgi:beta-lactamase class A
LSFAESTRARGTASALLASLTLTLAACQGHDTVQLLSPLPATGTLNDGSAVSDTPAPPNTAAGRQLSWLLQVINERADQLLAKEIQQHFQDLFLSVMPSEDLQEQFSSLAREQAPLTFLEVSTDTSDMSLLALVEGNRARLTIGMNIEPGTGKISGLQFTQVEDRTETRPLDSWNAIDQSVAELAPSAQYLVARLGASECEPLHSRAPEQRLALGSSASLYVLAELARQIHAGALSWDTPITIEDAFKSLPSGELQYLPSGSQVSIREAADNMIAISDNTAADHLMALLGRENIEAGLAATGHQAPQLNVPFLSTRELFLFRLEVAEQQTDAYLSGSVSARRAFLSELAGQAPRLESAVGWFLPRRIEQLEWFASSDDLCRLMLSLQTSSQAPGLAPLRNVLSGDPGLPLDDEIFPYVAFKGGSEPGVLNLTWFVERRDGARFFVSLGLNDPTAPILDNASVLRTALAIFDLLGTSN